MTTRSRDGDTQLAAPSDTVAGDTVPLVTRSTGRTPRADAPVSYQPILDVSRGVAAGFHVVAHAESGLPGGRIVHPAARRLVTADTVATALAASATLPTNTFISIPVPLRLVGDSLVKTLLHDHGDLGGIVLDITDFSSAAVPQAEIPLDEYRRAGAMISVGGKEHAQPELGSIVRLRPSIIRLGREWIRDLDAQPHRRSAIELTGRLAGQLDAWILADGVVTAAELQWLAELEVPLARGSFVGEAHGVWPDIDLTARAALPSTPAASDGVLRALLQQAYTTSDPSASLSASTGVAGHDIVVVIDDRRRPVSLLEQSDVGRWDPVEVMTVNVDTPLADAVARAMARPRPTRFVPLVCTDAAGRFVGILRIERLVEHLSR